MKKIKIFNTVIIFVLIILLLLCFYKIISLQKNVNIYEEQTHNALEKVSSEEVVSVENRKKLEKLIKENTKTLNGKISYGIHLYDESYYYVNNDIKLKSASVIKLFIMELAYDKIAKKELAADFKISGSEIETLVEKMITVSDNNATNLLIEHFGMENINKFIAEQGYKNTVIERKMLDYDAMAAGKDNYTSVGDVMSFLDKLYEMKEKYPYSKMLEVMKKQQVRTKIRRNMPADVEIANKTGELSNVENDVGIVFTDKVDYAVVFLTNGAQSESARTAISKTTREIYDLIMQ